MKNSETLFVRFTEENVGAKKDASQVLQLVTQLDDLEIFGLGQPHEQFNSLETVDVCLIQGELE